MGTLLQAHFGPAVDDTSPRESAASLHGKTALGGRYDRMPGRWFATAEIESQRVMTAESLLVTSQGKSAGTSDNQGHHS
jgi:hypothetical protein